MHTYTHTAASECVFGTTRGVEQDTTSGSETSGVRLTPSYRGKVGIEGPVAVSGRTLQLQTCSTVADV